MSRPRLLDLFCGAGGAAMGYYRAGFDVVGVDIAPQPRYPFEFHQADAMSYPLAGFDAIHASPPCQAYNTTACSRKRVDHPDLLMPVRRLLESTGTPWVIENIPTAPMPGSFMLCGSGFGLPLVRHRRFWTSFDVALIPSGCPQSRFSRSVSHGDGAKPYAQGSWEAEWRRVVLPTVWPWMTLVEARQAIPPAYTEWIGAQLLRALEVAA